jgi:perosamine synthetase
LQSIPAARILFDETSREWVRGQTDQILISGALTLGKHTEAFEYEFASFVGARYAVAVNSGTSALEIPLRVLGVEGCEVILPTNTFFATAAAVIHAGGIPRFVDINPSDLAPDLGAVSDAITERTAGIITVHIGGMVGPTTIELADLCKKRGLFLLEDAAHAHGSELDGRSAGTFGIAAGFSFYPTKVMTSGEGGMIVSDDEQIATEARIYRDQGKAGFYENRHVRLGYNWRMSEVHAVLGRSQLEKLPEWLTTRRVIAQRYDEMLAGEDIASAFPVLPGVRSNYYKYVADWRGPLDRGELKRRLREDHSVSLSGEVYEAPLHFQPVFEQWAGGPLPIAEKFCASHICLPVYGDMTGSDAERVVEGLRRVTDDAHAR